jgi:hypothetical protein
VPWAQVGRMLLPTRACDRAFGSKRSVCLHLQRFREKLVTELQECRKSRYHDGHSLCVQAQYRATILAAGSLQHGRLAKSARRTIDWNRTMPLRRPRQIRESFEPRIVLYNLSLCSRHFHHISQAFLYRNVTIYENSSILNLIRAVLFQPNVASLVQSMEVDYFQDESRALTMQEDSKRHVRTEMDHICQSAGIA